VSLVTHRRSAPATCAVAGLRHRGGDQPIAGHPKGDAKHTVLAQPRRLGRPPPPTGRRGGQWPSAQDPRAPSAAWGRAPTHPPAPSRAFGSSPVTWRFTQGGVVVVASQRRAHRDRQLGLTRSAAARLADDARKLDHRVLGGHRIKQGVEIEKRGGAPQQHRRPRRGVTSSNNRAARSDSPAGTHPDQHRGVKGPRTHVKTAAAVQPRSNSTVTGCRSDNPSRTCSSHHRGHHRAGHRRASQRREFEQIGEILMRMRITLLSQQPIDDALHS